MRWSEIIENVSGIYSVNAKAICKKMIEAELNGKYWDDHAVAAYPEKLNGSDNAYDMVEDWRSGRFEFPFPEKFEDEDDDEIIESPEFKKFLIFWAKTRLAEVQKKLSEVPIINGCYKLHRIIKVSPTWLKEVKSKGQTNLGIYWTYDVENWGVGAYPVWADENMIGHELMFEALVPTNSIDWTFTILANMDWYSGDQEFEMRPLKGSKLQVLSCMSGKKKVDIRGIEFFA